MVMFFSPTCPHSIAMMPYFEKYADEFKGKIAFARIDIVGRSILLSSRRSLKMLWSMAAHLLQNPRLLTSIWDMRDQIQSISPARSVIRIFLGRMTSFQMFGKLRKTYSLPHQLAMLTRRHVCMPGAELSFLYAPPESMLTPKIKWGFWGSPSPLFREESS